MTGSPRIPLKLRIAALFSDGEAHSLDDVLAALGPEYGRERQFTRERLDEHLKALRVVGIIQDDRVELDQKNQLLVTYRISDFGRAKLHRVL